jgi:Arc/MetJ family transcription regulator
MRTTVTIDDDLLAEAKVAAARSRRTFSSVVEEALREHLSGARQSGDVDVVLPAYGTAEGRMLVNLTDRDALADALGENAPPW